VSNCKHLALWRGAQYGRTRTSSSLGPAHEGIILTLFFFWLPGSSGTSSVIHAVQWEPFLTPLSCYLAMMILVGLWQHMFLGDWPFQEYVANQPAALFRRS